MKKIFPHILNTFCYVTILVLLVVVSIYSDVMNNMFPLSFLWYAIATGAASALLTLLFLTDVVIKEFSERLRMVLFLASLYISVTSLSILFDIVNPAHIYEIITMFVTIAIIFLVVWAVNSFSFRQQEKELTDKLREFNESFED